MPVSFWLQCTKFIWFFLLFRHKRDRGWRSDGNEPATKTITRMCKRIVWLKTIVWRNHLSNVPKKLPRRLDPPFWFMYDQTNAWTGTLSQNKSLICYFFEEIFFQKVVVSSKSATTYGPPTWQINFILDHFHFPLRLHTKNLLFICSAEIFKSCLKTQATIR